MTQNAGTADALKDVLRGYGRQSREDLQRLRLFDGWQRVAAQELERRATQIVQVLDEDSLRAIAAGDIDFQAVCSEVEREIGLK
jgi:hypothetical protein